MRPAMQQPSAETPTAACLSHSDLFSQCLAFKPALPALLSCTCKLICCGYETWLGTMHAVEVWQSRSVMNGVNICNILKSLATVSICLIGILKGIASETCEDVRKLLQNDRRYWGLLKRTTMGGCPIEHLDAGAYFFCMASKIPCFGRCTFGSR